MADISQITPISRTDSQNAASNPIIVQLSDGTTVLSTTTGALNVDVQNTSITVAQATHDNLNANVNLQVGDTDVANGNPVPVSDAGGSITVDGTVAATQSGTWTVDSITNAVTIQDGGGSITVDGTVAISGSVTVTATDLDIRDLVQSQDSVRIYANTAKDGSGTAYIPIVDSDGQLQVDVLTMPAISFDDASGTRIHDFQTDAAVAAASSVNHDYTSTTASGFKLLKILAASSGASKITVEIGQAGSGVTKAAAFIPPQGGEVQIDFNPGLIVANTEEVRVVHTNRSLLLAQDLYSTIMGDQLT